VCNSHSESTICVQCVNSPCVVSQPLSSFTSLEQCTLGKSVHKRCLPGFNSFSLHIWMLWSCSFLEGFSRCVCSMCRKDFGQLFFYTFFRGHSKVNCAVSPGDTLRYTRSEKVFFHCIYFIGKINTWTIRTIRIILMSTWTLPYKSAFRVFVRLCERIFVP
jgi:hypothetical protein